MSDRIFADFNKIKKAERNKLNGYVPNWKKTSQPDPNSGVTIAAGLDLGGKSLEELRREFELPERILKKLEPYIGKKGLKARAALRKTPLIVDDADANFINSSTERVYKNRAANQLEEADIDIKSLPEEVQHAAVDTVFNAGSLVRKTKKGKVIKDLRQSLKTGGAIQFGEDLKSYKTFQKGHVNRRKELGDDIIEREMNRMAEPIDPYIEDRKLPARGPASVLDKDVEFFRDLPDPIIEGQHEYIQELHFWENE